MFDAVGSSLILSLNGNIYPRCHRHGPGCHGRQRRHVDVERSRPEQLRRRSGDAAERPAIRSATTSPRAAPGALSTYWTNQAGAFQVNTSSGTATAFAARQRWTWPRSTASAMLPTRRSASRSARSPTGEQVGLVARYSGSGLANMYYGSIVATSADTYTAYIYLNVNGVWTTLFSQNYTGHGDRPRRHWNSTWSATHCSCP